MTTRGSEVEAVVRTLVREGRQRIGDPPSVEELMAYHRNELSEQEADQMQERLAHYPDSVCLLDALASYPYEGEPGDPEYLSDEELEQAWEAVQDHLHYEAKVVPLRKEAARPSDDKIFSFDLRPVAAIAACLLVAVAGTWFIRQGEVNELSRALKSPSSDVESQLLIPDGLRTARGGGPSIQLPTGSEEYYLNLSVIEAPQFRDYRIEILDPADPGATPLWSEDGVERRRGDTFELLLPRDFLTVRKIEIRLYGLDEQGKTLLATYTVEL